MRKLFRSAAFYVVLALLVLAIASSFLHGAPKRDKLTLSDFEKAVAAKQVKTAEIIDGGDVVRGELANGHKYEAHYPADYASDLTKELKENGVATYDAKKQKDNVLLSLLFNFLPFIVIFGAMLFIINSMQGGGNRVMQFG